MTATVEVSTYLKHRREGIPAKLALDWARQSAAPKIPQTLRTGRLTYDHPVQWEQDGFVLTASLRDDDYNDLSHLGKFSDRWKPGALILSSPEYARHEYRYFIPTNTEEQHYRDLRAMKYGRAQAREMARSYVRQDYQRAKSAGEDWSYLAVVVAVTRKGVQLALQSCGGIESDSDEDYFREVAADLASEAIEQAKARLAELCHG